MSVAIIIPFRPGCPHRQAALEHVRARHADSGAWPVVLGVIPPDEPWCKGAAVAATLEVTDADVLVISDADVLVDQSALDQAVSAVEAGAPWAMPHRKVRRLAEASTESLLAGEVWDRFHVHREPYEGVMAGGILVVDRATYIDVGGFDQRFLDWGGEDLSLGCALTLLHGPMVRFDAELLHLYHPWQTHQESPVTKALRLRYRQAFKSRDPRVMRALIEEASPWTSLASSTSPPR